MNTPILIRCWPGLLPYFTVLDAMREFTSQRDADTPDQMWLLQHPPVFTLGRNADAADVLDPGPIPVIRSDRGGKVTYHGPGQWVVYLLIDLPRIGINVRTLTTAMEQSVIHLLQQRGVTAHARRDAPGVYVGDAKIASLGLRIQRGRSYHGLSLNTEMDLSPFQRIHPCGMVNLAVTQVHDLCPDWPSHDVAETLMAQLAISLDRPLRKGGA
ncbi:MAG: lipoyl(octanoyl) transferase LipB [Acidithiobacillus ferrivorans]|uniref:Octanoyltransferase n=1 Tax=Acidithiobacillus ferrivorans SS3 TaxID=743299 RepID=G0JQ11_9PROT|nr:lipoyl(octanoyl) transferase LipB [Acidithiobacillus ferrivorans]AEM48594.1 Octanoyltransferase [Acidithiobacillus ferrivorans SS3]MBU2765073.1 lipoyl(octanoyl) transferase LipB [Acidithiobacillus ferrivorans]MBU2852037.1 lipoyl(octanoyl) transferase LipB [Acidithiobacillus ferrivorans]OFA15707.1 octanoyltransferase [Acidithiobacillus ferrivorans]